MQNYRSNPRFFINLGTFCLLHLFTKVLAHFCFSSLPEDNNLTVKTMPSVRKVWGSIPESVKSDSVATAAMFLRSCAAPALRVANEEMGPASGLLHHN